MSDYNGWKNYPTWNVKLWLDNEPGTYEAAQEIARECAEYDPTMDPNLCLLSADYWTPENVRGSKVGFCAERLKEYVEELAGDAFTDASFVADLLGWALEQVDWRGIAESYMDEIAEESAQVQS